MDAKKDSIKELIDFEISRLDAVDKNRGWSRWALYAAFCAVVWVGINETEKNGLDYRGGLLAWVLLSISYSGLRLINIAIGSGGKPQRKVVLLLPKTKLGQAAFLLLVRYFK